MIKASIIGSIIIIITEKMLIFIKRVRNQNVDMIDISYQYIHVYKVSVYRNIIKICYHSITNINRDTIITYLLTSQRRYDKVT